jgi:hypothetical protein
VAYKIFFEKDKNFLVRRIYLMGVMVLPFLLPLLPDSLRVPVSEMIPVSVVMEGVTVFASGSARETLPSLSFSQVAGAFYLVILTLGLLKLLIQLGIIVRAILISEKMEIQGTTLLSNPKLHASSFFSYIFIDPEIMEDESFQHILAHENIHKREGHSVDRILVEIFVMINWFNPVAWLFRRSVIQNLEYLADSAVLRKGTDPLKYQLSILNQYIGSASISNQFSSQIKNRINMLNKNYKLGSGWKLTILFPIVAIALIIVSCTDAEEVPATQIDEPEVVSEEIAGITPDATFSDEPVFRVVEEMPTFQGGDPTINFRKYIALNIQYPSEAAENGVTGRIFIQFVVTKEGKVIVPDLETFAKIEGKPMDEVVVVTYRTMEKGEEVPEDKYIQMLKDEVIRVVSSSPAWEPGKQRGQPVNVAFTFPVNFAMQ